MKLIEFVKKLSLLPQGVRYKLLIAFSLMSIIPLLVSGYIVNSTVFLGVGLSLGRVSVIFLFCIIIAWLGLILAKNITERVIDMAVESKIITEGRYDIRIPVDTKDEVGQIGDAINFLAKKIKDNIADLRDYQAKMKEINLDIQKRVSVLSSLLQIGELISSSVKLDAILDIILNKLSRFYEEGFAALYFTTAEEDKLTMRYSYNVSEASLSNAVIEKGKGILGHTLESRKYIVIDDSSKFSSKEHHEFRTKYKCENVIAYPLFLPKGGTFLLLVGNSMKNFTYTHEDVELVKIFAEQIAIAVENDILIKKAQMLEIKDDVTGLFNKLYIMQHLEEEISRSKISHRPCSLVLLDIDGYKKYVKDKGEPQAEIALRKIAHLLGEEASPLGRAGRFEEDTFGLILPEANKKEAMEVAEKARYAIEGMPLSAEKKDHLTISGGVSENPLDGANADEIYEKAKDALGSAKRKGKNIIVSSGA